MHSRAMVAKVRRLLAERQFSHRQIAAKLGISRCTVDNIARRDGPPQPDPPENAQDGDNPCQFAGQPVPIAPSGLSDPLDFEFDDEPLVYERCPTCGLRVTLPCLACRLEFEHQQRLRRARFKRRLAAPDWPPDFAHEISRVHVDELPNDDAAPRRRRRKKPPRPRPASGCSARAPD
ncbi:MAG: helix-turn-helix domain-containing protein [Pirellulales bacterium]|nr:helix-turn-helix domain-containing protein [Pirellulales bacterium]